MPTEVVSTLSPEQYLEIIKIVHDFFDSSFTKLLWLIGILGSIVGIVIPIYVNWYNARLLKLKENEISRRLAESVRESEARITDSIIKLIEEKVLVVTEAYKKDIQFEHGTINVSLRRLEGIIFHTLGTSMYSSARYVESIDAACIAIPHLQASGEEMNLRRACHLLQVALAAVNSTAASSSDVKTRYDSVIKVLKDNNAGGRYVDLIESLENSYKDALARS